MKKQPNRWLIFSGLFFQIAFIMYISFLLGREVKLHPVVIITAVLIFGGIWGFWGLLLAIPIATFLRAIIAAWPTREELIN